jgi:hypothetical protein
MTRRSWSALGALFLALGCGGSNPTAPTQIPSSTSPSAPGQSRVPTHSVSGKVTAAGAPVPGAEVVEIATELRAEDCFTPQVLSGTVTDAGGSYSLPEVLDSSYGWDRWVRASKGGYFTEFKRPRVVENTRLDIALEPLSFISVGQSVRQTLQLGDTPCYGNSYGGGPCRRFALAVPAAGTFEVSLSWPRNRPDMVVDVVGPDNSPCAHFSWPGATSHQVRLPAEAGSIFQIRVVDDGNASPIDFELKTALN